MELQTQPALLHENPDVASMRDEVFPSMRHARFSGHWTGSEPQRVTILNWGIIYDSAETLERLDWSNMRRLLGPIGDVPPAEFEAQYYH